MELSTRAMVLGVSLAVATPVASQAQVPKPATPVLQKPGIVGFLAMNWGATAKNVLDAYGAPLMDQTTPDSVRVIVYKDQVLGKSVLALFYLDRANGLVKGVYSASYTEGSDCETVFQKFHSFVQRLYPALPGDEKRQNNEPATPFCDAAGTGKASWSVAWADPANGSSVHLTLEPEEKQVEVAYQSRAFKPVKP